MLREIAANLGWILPVGIFLVVVYCIRQEMKTPAK